MLLGLGMLVGGSPMILSDFTWELDTPFVRKLQLQGLKKVVGSVRGVRWAHWSVGMGWFVRNIHGLEGCLESSESSGGI